jgi:ABC-type bacteriocin/lantibiotic exporter with double-glycine peptidase domain
LPDQTCYSTDHFLPSLWYDVPLVPQPNKLSCWAASMSMLLSYYRGQSSDPEGMAQEIGTSLRTSYSWGLLEKVKNHFGFQEIVLPSGCGVTDTTPKQWYEWLRSHGPLWVSIVGNPAHAIVVQGISGDYSPEGTTIAVLNPWNPEQGFDNDMLEFHPRNAGKAYSLPFGDFRKRFRDTCQPGNWKLLYLGRVP